MIQKGDVCIAVGKGFAAKPRPVVVLQSEDLSVTDTLVATLMTSVDNPEPSVRFFVPATIDNGLQFDSFVMIDKIMPVELSKIARVVGKLTDEQMDQIDKMILSILQISSEAS